jgi:hypothetical protein
LVSEPILAAVALTLATKTAEGIAEGGRAAFAALANWCNARFEHRPSATVALIEAEAHPTDERIQVLRHELELAAGEDSGFEAQLRSLCKPSNPGWPPTPTAWRTTSPDRSAEASFRRTTSMEASVSGTLDRLHPDFLLPRAFLAPWTKIGRLPGLGFCSILATTRCPSSVIL